MTYDLTPRLGETYHINVRHYQALAGSKVVLAIPTGSMSFTSSCRQVTVAGDLITITLSTQEVAALKDRPHRYTLTVTNLGVAAGLGDEIILHGKVLVAHV